ncbi:DUF4123 domain-containing protein [Achromobacter arsenitoxydans]|uniref:DUF4123 domain-containing protein n=1 Tax=Achromobacter arsenitoxydans SY8 TaxID=477184 RepID=H0FDL5_9BURK|nr:DUF4123 domain-containing protein [Achromobacter arsenitoxydans]EHK63600.1 hypothetical protein KYC_23897 [Achromobacter arsenitoxydans SY8]
MSIAGTAAPHTSLGKDITQAEIPATPFRYLLLMTTTLQNQAYRPVPQEGEFRPAYAPGVLDLVKAFDPFPHYAWVWQGTALDDYFDRGPLLVDATGQAALVQHALEHWAPANGVIIIGSGEELGGVSAHLRAQVRVSLPDQSEAALDIRPHHLAPWLDALDGDQRDLWLGPISTLVWRASWGPAYDWRCLDRPVAAFTFGSPGAFALRPDELARFEANTREQFVLSRVYEIHAMPAHSARSLTEIRRWVEQLLQVADRLYIQDDADVERYLALIAGNLWLLHSDEARVLLNDLTESPQARLRKLEALAREKESSNG